MPNAHAQQLARAHRTAVGVIVHDVSDPYFAEITRGLQRVATDHGRLVIICNSYRDPERELEYVELLRAHQVAAIVLAGSGYHDAPFTAPAQRQAARSTRAPAAGSRSSAGTSTPATRWCRTTSTAATWPATRSTALGHTADRRDRRPARTSPPPPTASPALRRAAREHGHRLLPGSVVYADFDRDGGAAAAADLLDAQPGPDRDRGAQRLDGRRRAGLPARARHRRAGRISVIGFDDMPIARDVTPPLTTVRLPLVEMGVRAMSLALSQPSTSPRVERRCRPSFVERESTFPL